ncbi:hypothetical protein H8790_11970 [Oscillibacter hominis]|uniref:Uncharacterized protein n=1 Tax=Oscillibacter hominis TaxID=2763056 RepID=A0A7G9B3K9_9FIRM|nr:hypothetical protein [Oscillibacter hominis]QNL44140.1 hypothetical protein H8790_11970 [Oscillibacter hominis]
MPITKPILPPKAGYVEIVSADGLHIYKPTPETARKLAEAEANQAAGDITLDLMAEHEERLCMLELTAG